LPQHLYAETLLSPGLGVVFQWRFQNCGHHLLDILDPASPVHGALRQAIERFENTVFELAPDKPTLIEWANSQKTLQDTADRRELRLGGAHVFQQSIELFQGMQMMTDRVEDPHRLAAIHHDIGDVMGFIGQRSGSAHFLEQAAMSYEQALELRTQDGMPREWAQTTSNLGLVMLTLGSLQDDASMLKQALQTFKEAVNFLPREEMPEDWAAALCNVATLLCLLGTHRRGARTLEQSVVAYRNALGERTPEKDLPAWIVTQNNLATAMQALGEHEEDIASLEASIPLYDAVLKVLDDDRRWARLPPSRITWTWRSRRSSSSSGSLPCSTARNTRVCWPRPGRGSKPSVNSWTACRCKRETWNAPGCAGRSASRGARGRWENGIFYRPIKCNYRVCMHVIEFPGPTRKCARTAI
jgi:tetratricopeptide (TPR) repeat protein